MIPATYATPIALVLLIAVALLAVWVYRLEARIKKLLLGKSGESLESTINTQSTQLGAHDATLRSIQTTLAHMNARIKTSIQGAETIRFNPFEGVGGNQSFATALLDEDGTGVVLSSLYSREKVSVFAKPVKTYLSEYELSTEERQVIANKQKGAGK